ncbi:MAG: tRNA 2-thiouridine(34) synthase MnmA [Verrucomicrobiota bacterium]|jgi:tRNA-specific 2-thiouridylase
MNTAVLLSGGVDSSVALAMLNRQGGHRLTAFYLKIWLEDELAFLGECPWEEDLKNARAVCAAQGVPLEVISMQREYHSRVVSYVIDELKQGRTPSPDILCNERVKFGAFFDAIDASWEKVATGHYAQVSEDGGLFRLRRAPDPVKDQTYFLSALSQKQLSRILFPIGHLQKSEVRSEAAALDLFNKDRKDSQGICFLGKIKYNDFVRFHLGEKEGWIVELETGKRLGRHKGVWFHTIGQRTGLGLSGGPWFVVRKELDDNTVFVSHKDHAAEIACREIALAELHWCEGSPPPGGRIGVKLRHGPRVLGATLHLGEGASGRLSLDEADPGVAPGQSAVIYDGDYCLGRGVIQRGLPA